MRYRAKRRLCFQFSGWPKANCLQLEQGWQFSVIGEIRSKNEEEKEMLKRKKAVSIFLALLIFVNFFDASAYAACSHTLGVQQYEVAHPHRYYRQCTKCRTKIYTGATRILPHGSGAVGSGTCKSCGTHSYTGRSCTSIGKCACGATIAAYGHNYGETIYYETAHPHKNLKKCNRCSTKYYNGAITSLTHGDGSSGTCKSCGVHSYKPSGVYATGHPHESMIECVCGDSITAYGLKATCSQCTNNSKTASSSTPTTGVMAYQDGDQGLGSGIFVPVTYYVEYTNTYNYPQTNDPMNNYHYPAFAQCQ